MRFFEFLSEGIGWLKIVASPLIAGAIIGALVYSFSENTVGLFVGIAITLLGLIIGIIWATRIWKKQGAMEFLSRINSSHEIDNLDKTKVKK
ncbi:MAG: hypothetical protein WCO28_11110 [Bacteroidota bacterium]